MKNSILLVTLFLLLRSNAHAAGNMLIENVTAKFDQKNAQSVLVSACLRSFPSRPPFPGELMVGDLVNIESFSSDRIEDIRNGKMDTESGGKKLTWQDTDKNACTHWRVRINQVSPTTVMTFGLSIYDYPQSYFGLILNTAEGANDQNLVKAVLYDTSDSKF
jgi:hypothetical protein